MTGTGPSPAAPLRVLRLLTRPNLGGPTAQAIALWHAHRAAGVATLLVTGEVGPGETPLDPAAHGVPALDLAAALAAGPLAAGWVTLPGLGRAVAPWQDQRARRGLAALLRTQRPHVVHTHTSKAGWLGRPLARRLGVPVVAHTFHGHVLQDYFGALRSRALAWLERRLARRTDLLLAVSASCADELAALGIAARERFAVVPPAVALPDLVPRPAARAALGIAPAARRVAFVGRLVPIKRPLDAVAAVAAVPGLEACVVGDGPLHGAVAAAAAAAAPGRITLRGARPGFAAWLAAYDALLLPSRREGYPLAAVEALAAGVPVLGYDVPGLRDALRGGGGALVPEREGPPGLARVLQAWQSMPPALPPRAAVLAAFAPTAVAAQLLAAYRAALAAAPAR